MAGDGIAGLYKRFLCVVGISRLVIEDWGISLNRKNDLRRPLLIEITYNKRRYTTAKRYNMTLPQELNDSLNGFLPQPCMPPTPHSVTSKSDSLTALSIEAASPQHTELLTCASSSESNMEDGNAPTKSINTAASIQSASEPGQIDPSPISPVEVPGIITTPDHLCPRCGGSMMLRPRTRCRYCGWPEVSPY